MSDRYAGFVVSLDRSLRDDDAEATINAIRMIQGVVDVKPIEESFEIHIAMDRVRSELRQKLWEVLK